LLVPREEALYDQQGCGCTCKWAHVNVKMSESSKCSFTSTTTTSPSSSPYTNITSLPIVRNSTYLHSTHLNGTTCKVHYFESAQHPSAMTRMVRTIAGQDNTFLPTHYCARREDLRARLYISSLGCYHCHLIPHCHPSHPPPSQISPALAYFIPFCVIPTAPLRSPRNLHIVDLLITVTIRAARLTLSLT
jgi:hypothetical protein